MKTKLFRSLMQFLGFLPKIPCQPYCMKKLWLIKSFENLQQHNCLNKDKHGLIPCKNLRWYVYNGEHINLQLLRFMGWENSKFIAKIDAEIQQSWLPKKGVGE